MYCLDVIKSDSYQNRAKIRDNFNRESSACFSKAGAVIHSGIFRSTCFIATDSTAYAPLRYWQKQESQAFDEWINQIVGDSSIEGADEKACRIARPDWKFTAQTRKGFEHVTATKQDGALQLKHSANSWREIHFLTK